MKLFHLFVLAAFITPSLLTLQSAEVKTVEVQQDRTASMLSKFKYVNKTKYKIHVVVAEVTHQIFTDTSYTAAHSVVRELNLAPGQTINDVLPLHSDNSKTSTIIVTAEIIDSGPEYLRAFNNKTTEINVSKLTSVSLFPASRVNSETWWGDTYDLGLSITQ